jgi:aryl-alcohol dehydrogenase-like predicted oxidoreductase
MRYKLLGKSGLKVSELCLGTMAFGEDWGWGASLQESRRIFEAFAEAGGNFIDTADMYTKGTSERFVGEFVASERHRYVVATKYSSSVKPNVATASGNSRKCMVEAIEASLRRLGTDYVDLYWLHCWDYLTPVEEVMRAFDDLVRAGKVLYVGMSNTPAWIVARADMLAEQRGWTPPVALQIEYNLLQREVEREYVRMAEALDLATCAWSPLAGGGLLVGGTGGELAAGAVRRAMAARATTERTVKVAATLVEIAGEIGCSAAQVAINWLRQRSRRTIPIVGARTLPQVQDALGCLGFQLGEAHMERLNEVSWVEPGWPYSLFTDEAHLKRTYGGFYDRIDNLRKYGP